MTVAEFNANCNSIQGLLYSFAYKLTKNGEDAKDLIQETTMRAFKNKDRFTMGTNFKAWITTIMRNCFINEYRKRKTRQRVLKPLEENQTIAINQKVENNAGSVIMMKELNKMLDNLPDTHKKPFELFFNGYEYQEISEQLDIPMGTVKSRIFYARKKMQEMVVQRYGINVPRRA